MPVTDYKPLMLIITMFIGGYLSGQFWHYLGDQNNIVNRYLEVHNSRFISDADSNQIYYVFYKDFAALNEFVDSHTNLKKTQTTSIDKVATVNIDKSSLPDSLNLLREQNFIRSFFRVLFPLFVTNFTIKTPPIFS